MRCLILAAWFCLKLRISSSLSLTSLFCLVGPSLLRTTYVVPQAFALASIHREDGKYSAHSSTRPNKLLTQQTIISTFSYLTMSQKSFVVKLVGFSDIRVTLSVFVYTVPIF